MNTPSIVLQLVSVGLLVYILLKITEVENSIEDLKIEQESITPKAVQPPPQAGTVVGGPVMNPDLSAMFRPIAKEQENKEDDIVELENDSVDDTND